MELTQRRQEAARQRKKLSALASWRLGVRWRRLWTALRLLFIAIIIIVAIAPEWPAFQAEPYQFSSIVQQRRFDYLIWEINALWLKGRSWLAGGQSYLDEATRQAFVLDYLSRVEHIHDLERTLNAIYAGRRPPEEDFERGNPAALGLQAEIDQQRAELERRQPMAEAIIQEQVAAVLAEEEFGVLGQIWPPVSMHMTPLPSILVVSPRAEIRQLYSVSLQHDLPTSTHIAIEDRVYDELDRSALVVPIGGAGIYPAMIIETSNINFLADVVAHEWAHHWLTLRPLGIRYMAGPDLRTINETVASIVGAEIGEQVVERFYPEFAPPELEEPEILEETPQIEPAPADPTAFDFRLEMARTRIRVDELLAQGLVEEAEAYMEARRQMFVEQGYNIRRLNQAYFAFYGAYADVPGATGGDPIGPLVRTIREASPSLHAFLTTVSSVTTLEELEQLEEALQVASGR